MHRTTIKESSTADTAVLVTRMRSCTSTGTLKANPSHHGMNLTSFVAQYVNFLPLHVTICSNYHSGDINFVKGERYCIQSVAKNNTIAVKENNSTICELPLNAMDNFGLVCNPNGSHSEQINGCNFRSVTDILKLQKLPLVIKCTKSKSALVKKGEILITQGRRTNSAGEEVLNTISFSLNTKKSLSESCVASFTTQPQMVQLPLSKIVQLLLNDFPLMAMAFSDEIKKRTEPLSILTLEYNTTQSLIMNSAEGKSAAVIELPINTPIKVDIDNQFSQSQTDCSIDSDSSPSITEHCLSEPAITNEYANLSTWIPQQQNSDNEYDKFEKSVSFEIAMQGQIDELKAEISEIKKVITYIKLKIDSLQIEQMQGSPKASKALQDRDAPDYEVSADFGLLYPLQS